MYFNYDDAGWFIGVTDQPTERSTVSNTPYTQSAPDGARWNWTGNGWVALPFGERNLGTRITVGAFFDRFGQHKWAILADQNPAVQALIKDCSVRKFIDLSRPDLPVALGIIAQSHEIDAEAILSAPVQESELPS